MRVQFSSAAMSVRPLVADTQPVHFQGKFDPPAQNQEILKDRAESGHAQAQLDYAMYLYDNKVSKWLKFKANVLLPATMNFLALIPPLRVVHNVSDDTIECYKWLHLAKRKKGDITPNFVESWMRPLNLVMTKKDCDEAIRRAHVWLAEFEPEHRGGNYPDEVRDIVANARRAQQAENN